MSSYIGLCIVTALGQTVLPYEQSPPHSSTQSRSSGRPFPFCDVTVSPSAIHPLFLLICKW